MFFRTQEASLEPSIWSGSVQQRWAECMGFLTLPLPRSPAWIWGLAVTDSKWGSCWESAAFGSGNMFGEFFFSFFIIFVNVGQVLWIVEVFSLVCI